MPIHDLLAKPYYAWRRYIPSRVLYHPDFFDVLDVLAQGKVAVAAGHAELRLRHILVHALQHVPYYQRTVKLSAAEAARENLCEVFAAFPYLSKEEVMSQQRDFLDCRLDPVKLMYATSGGSSGQGIGLWRTKRLADIEKAFFTHEWGKLGFSFDKSRILRIGADARRLAHEEPARVVGNRLMLSPYHVHERHQAAIRDAIRRFQPEFVHAYPSSAAALAELLDAGELGVQVKAVLLASEPATAAQLASIRRLFRCPVSLNYGLSERTNLAFLTADETGAPSYRFQPLYGWSENRMDGDRPEIVGTSLWNDVMPLIRYRTNDYGLIAADGSCAGIDGRGHEFLVDRSGKRIPGLSIVIDEVTWDFVRLYQIRQRKAGEITLAVVPRHGSLNDEQRSFVLDAQLRRWGGFFDISLQEENDIPLSANGKRKLVVSSLDA
ncbi:AMP-binding protein [Massilia yuzhufengensis]|uniref:Phenylacetate-CoA ligase n=1 Tax=Massilia yuzhufengensis TaxID=1164594 RepID=A0A1I1D9T0_9BURK|nr:AMP-binding protein [Massilia yuzhufengensis]SFB71779.1 phenylacetate-CoA ligase [Massilia yuzhufengensis]